ncbi:hypothetical protein HXA35_18505 [Bacillus sp. A301a_S52]|jgi:hypothetical protein|nr:hypothetical protein [Bacillus sp. A301a_S52]
MKRKLLLTALTSMFVVGVLGACGDMENEPMNDNGGLEDNGMNDGDI